MTLDVSALKVGDEVAFGRFVTNCVKLARVAKINRWGHVTLDNGKVFDKFGSERIEGRFGPRNYLIDAAQAREWMERQVVQRKRNTAAREIEGILQGRRNGYGDVCEVDAETKAKLLELVNSL